MTAREPDRDKELIEVDDFSVCRRVVKDRLGKPVTVVEPVGPLDSYTAPSLEAMLRSVFAGEGDAARFVVIDCHRVNYVSSAGASVLLGWRETALDRGGNLHFAGMGPDVSQVFELMEVISQLAVYDTVDEAVDTFRA
jgi:anti-anti-sigma factor